MSLPQQLFAVRPIGDTDNPYWFAATEDGENPNLETGELILNSFRCRVTSHSPARWQIDEMQAFLTDRRIIFLSTKFDKGGGWVGFGGPAVVVASIANTVSKRRAASRSIGKVAAGQIRFEWLTAEVVRTKKALIGVVDLYVHLTAMTSAGTQIIEIWKNKVVTNDLADQIASMVIDHRLNLGVELSPEVISGLKRLQSGERLDLSSMTHHKGDKGWLFAGNHEDLVKAASARVLGLPQE